MDGDGRRNSSATWSTCSVEEPADGTLLRVVGLGRRPANRRCTARSPATGLVRRS